MDIRLKWDAANGRADLALVEGDLDTSQELETMVIVSLFSDRRADRDDPLPPFNDDPRGWWGDSLASVQGDRIGSKLWLLENGKSDNTLPLRAKGYILEALAWMLEDGIATTIDAECFFLQNDQQKLGAIITIQRVGSAITNSLRFDGIWAAEMAQR